MLILCKAAVNTDNQRGKGFPVKKKMLAFLVLKLSTHDSKPTSIDSGVSEHH
jgi:hypothetical protein